MCMRAFIQIFAPRGEAGARDQGGSMVPVAENLAIECKNFHTGVGPLFLSYLISED